jgi:hypothetical protein
MNRNRLILIVLILLVVGIGGWLYLRSGRENVAVDLVQTFPSAKIRRPGPEAFSVIDAKINGDSKRAIFTKEDTRIGWSVTIPDNAWLKVSLGILEDGWKVQGDGVLFMVGVSDGKTYDELLKLTVNPFGNQSDRRWNDISLDLSQYAGETVDVIFNTRSGPTGDHAGDLAAWGNPRIIVR